MQRQLCGGITLEDKEATADVQELISQVKEQVEAKLNGSFSAFEAVSYRTQVVAGTNFFVKACLRFYSRRAIQAGFLTVFFIIQVHVGNESYLHLRIWRKLDRQLELTDVQAEKLRTDPISYF